MHSSTLPTQSMQTDPQQTSGETAVPLQPGASAGLSNLQDEVSMILCCYQNHSPKIQIIRSDESQRLQHPWHLERVIFPGQRLMFEAPERAKIHVYSSDPVGMLVDDTVPCDRIQVQDQ